MIHLHVHTKYSLLDSTIKIEELMQRVKDLGQTAIAITDHGNMYGSVEFYKIAKNYGIKPIIGCEMYICSDVTIMKRENKMYHLILLAKNEIGRQNLQKLVSESTKYKFDKRPRIDFQMLEKYHDGLICLSACMAGELSRALENNDNVLAKNIATKYKALFNDDYYIEYQAHTDFKQQELNLQLVELAKELGIKYVVTCDAHYLYEEDQKYQSIYIQIGSAREVGETYNDCYIQSEYEVINNCRSTIQYNSIAINNTEEIAQKCNVDYPLSAPIIPHVDIPSKFKNEEDYLKFLCNDGMKKKGFLSWDLDQWKNYMSETVYDEFGNAEIKEFVHVDSVKDIVKKYKDRAKYELNAVVKMGFQGYYLLVHSYISSAKRRGIARGSAGGSLLAYLSGIVDIDPIKYGLYFERFIDVGALELLESNKITRKELKIPDVDADFSPKDRDTVMQFIINKYKEENVVCIGTFGYLLAKSAIKDIGKVLKIPFETTNTITKNIDNETIDEALNQGLLDEYKYQYPELFEYASKLSGLPKSRGVHACGKIICMRNADYYNAIEYDADKQAWVLEGDMHTADDLGLVKIDLLGLRTLDVVYDVLDMVGEDYSFIAPHKIDLCDKATWNEFSKGNTLLIFQFESPGMRQMLKDMKCNSIDNLSAANALYRPGSKQYIPSYIARKKGEEDIVYINDMLKPILESTYGIIVYQEQLIEIGKLAGLKNPDELRQATAKKKIKLMNKIEPEMKNGLINLGWAQAQVDKLWDDILLFAKYSFNKCVSGSTILLKPSVRKSVRNPSVEEMYKIVHDLQYAKDNNYLPLRSKYLRIGNYGTALSMFDDGKVRKNRIIDIQPAGVREVYKVETLSGKWIECTDNHKFPTPCGKKMLCELKIGDELYILGDYRHKQYDYNFTDGNFERNYPIKGQCGFQTITDGESVKYNDYIYECRVNKKNCEVCGCEYDGLKRFEMHHIDKNRHNNDKSNLKWCCAGCHKKLDYALGRTKTYDNGIEVLIDQIVSIKYVRDEMTYDVTMDDPAHNFVTNNGLITCNSHSGAYGLTAYITMYLKVHYPVEFITASINSYDGDSKSISKVIDEARRMGVCCKYDYWKNIQPETIRKNNIVYLGINTIKGFGKDVCKEIQELQSCQSFLDILINTNGGNSHIDTMIEMNFFNEYGEIYELKQIQEVFKLVYNKKMFNKSTLLKQEIQIPEYLLKQYSKETDKQYRELQGDKIFNEMIKNLKPKKTSIIDIINFEMENLGFLLSTMPEFDDDYQFVLEIDKNWMTLYQLSDGTQLKIKFRKNVWNNNPIEAGQIMKVLEIRPEKKFIKNPDGTWGRSDEYEQILHKWSVVRS